MGWAVDRGLRFRLGDQDIPFRLSAVSRRGDGARKTVRVRSSVGVLGEEAAGVALPT